jgi:hypothetical protein
MSDLRKAAQQALEALTTPIHEQPFGLKQNAVTALRAALAQEEQAPVAWSSRVEWGPRQSEQVIKVTRTKQEQYGFTVPLYTTPPQRPRLTDEEIDAAAKSVPAAVYELMYGNEITVEKFRAALAEFARAIERKVRGE